MVEKGALTTDMAKKCHSSAILATSWLVRKLSNAQFTGLGVHLPMCSAKVR